MFYASFRVAENMAQEFYIMLLSNCEFRENRRSEKAFGDSRSSLNLHPHFPHLFSDFGKILPNI
jgi:hypothetical protein